MDSLSDPIDPDVPDFVLKDATEVEKHLLKEASVAKQQNQRIIAAVQKVYAQVLITNGRVTAHDKKIETLEKSAERFETIRKLGKKYTGWVIGGAALLLPPLYSFLDKWIAKLFTPIILCACLLFGGCAAKDSHVVRKATAVHTQIVEVRKATAVVTKKAEAVKGSIEKAQVTAGQLFTASPVELRPIVEKLQFELTIAHAANTDLLQANAEAEAAALAADERSAEAIKAASIESDARQKAEDKSAVLEKKVTLQTKLAWKWRLYFFGLFALVVGFFVLRQYFPFLKLI